MWVAETMASAIRPFTLLPSGFSVRVPVRFRANVNTNREARTPKSELPASSNDLVAQRRRNGEPGDDANGIERGNDRGRGEQQQVHPECARLEDEEMHVSRDT